MKIKAAFIIGLVHAGYDLRPKTLSVCGPYTGARDMNSNSIEYDSEYISRASDVYDNNTEFAKNSSGTIITAYDCLCGNSISQYMMPCEMGSWCDFASGYCTSPCAEDQQSHQFCFCSRPVNETTGNASQHNVDECQKDQYCVGYGSKNQGTCVDSCPTDSSATKFCACAGQNGPTYCEVDQYCSEGTCMDECNTSDTTSLGRSCMCISELCQASQFCTQQGCFSSCADNVALSESCLCSENICQVGDSCFNSECKSECLQLSDTNCWCGSSDNICSTNNNCYQGNCISRCNSDSVLFSQQQECVCGTSVCDVTNPFCLGDQLCVPPCPAGPVSTTCKCNSFAFCSHGDSCQTSGACVSPTPVVPTPPPAPLPTCANEWGPCGGQNHHAIPCCDSSLQCLANQSSYNDDGVIYYKQCVRKVLSSKNPDVETNLKNLSEMEHTDDVDACAPLLVGSFLFMTLTVL